MSESFDSAIHGLIIKLSEPIRKALSETPYNPPPESISVEAILHDLLVPKASSRKLSESQVRSSLRDFALACALLASSKSSDHDLLSWIPEALSSYAESAFGELSEACSGVSLVAELVPALKEAIKESSMDRSEEVDEITAAHGRAPVGMAIVGAYQFRWLVSQIGGPHLAALCSIVVPCALTALDHWSPEVKGQGMISFIHIGTSVDMSAIGCYADAILDACCHNMASADNTWHLLVEMSVLFLTPTNPRTAWFERILSEMLSHLERQPRNKGRRVAWLQHIEPLFHTLGLLVLPHFRRIFPLFLEWMRADDDETVVLVLKQVHTVIRLTWIRNTPYIERVVDELAALSSRKSRDDIRSLVSQILILLHECKGVQFQADDLNMAGVFLQEQGMLQR